MTENILSVKADVAGMDNKNEIIEYLNIMFSPFGLSVFKSLLSHLFIVVGVILLNNAEHSLLEP